MAELTPGERLTFVCGEDEFEGDAHRMSIAWAGLPDAVEQDAHSWEDIKTIDDLGRQFAKELEEFFVNYHKLSGKQYRVLGLKGPDQARKLVKSGMR